MVARWDEILVARKNITVLNNDTLCNDYYSPERFKESIRAAKLGS